MYVERETHVVVFGFRLIIFRRFITVYGWRIYEQRINSLYCTHKTKPPHWPPLSRTLRGTDHLLGPASNRGRGWSWRGHSQMRLQPVHAHNFLFTSNLHPEKLDSRLENTVGAQVVGGQRRTTSSSPNIYKLGLLESRLQVAGNCLCVRARLGSWRRVIRGQPRLETQRRLLRHHLQLSRQNQRLPENSLRRGVAADLFWGST